MLRAVPAMLDDTDKRILAKLRQSLLKIMFNHFRILFYYFLIHFISILAKVMPKAQKTEYKHIIVIIHCPKMNTNFIFAHDFIS